MKHEPPQHIKEYLDSAYYRSPPKCCHTCELYQDDGTCFEFGMQPPADFAQTEDQCDKWIEVIPF